MKKTPSLDIRTLRRAVEALGVTLRRQGSQWILDGREIEPLGHSIQTERDALEFVLDRNTTERDCQDSGSNSGQNLKDLVIFAYSLHLTNGKSVR